ncbi:hypothetical protein E1A91_D04G066000v1 [Gossypium mustelinum]|uniref:Uncharacterized protein n=5 Tax=Gossypium TaxID=3633 RepID=A0A5J5RSG8_GOSBA|nr:hypothetical protein ES319_D04G064500v1 [Gossypium barbadense]TYI86460.1 hypothetical protein E1A91_D04G066000v1 [Gossypium mustelinum]
MIYARFNFSFKAPLMRIAHPSRCFFTSSISFARTQLNVSLKPLPSVSSSSMADPSNFSTVSAEDEAKYGFTREEMYSSNLAGTVNPYDRHLFLRHRSYTDWASRVEEDSLPKLFSSTLKSRKNDIPVKTLLTVIEGEQSDGDVLIFPEMIKYKGLTEGDLDGFVEDVLVNGKPWASGVQETFTGSYVFVCAHGNRDKRCGVCGPILIEKLNEEIALRGLKDQVFVNACSHIGGHKYAGNLIIFSPDSKGKITGHWYGYVTPEDVPELLDQHIANGKIIERLWRGQMGVSTESGDGTGEQKLPNGTEVKKNEKPEESTVQKTRENLGGCCQGANGSSCCMTASSEVSETKKTEETTEAHGKKGLCGLTSWVGSWEQRDVLTAAAVVGAVATVAVAYSYYRKVRLN